jgi:hypothetical protein
MSIRGTGQSARSAPDTGLGFRHLLFNPDFGQLTDFDGAYTLTRDRKYLDTLIAGMDFTLGSNPMNMSWVTGLGSRSPRELLDINCVLSARRRNGAGPDSAGARCPQRKL